MPENTTVAPSGANIRNLIRAVVSRSVADDFEHARLEWDVTDCYIAGEGDSVASERCICGHEPITECFVIKNRFTGEVIDPIGNVCVKQFRRQDMADIAKGFRDVARLRSAAIGLAPGERLPLRRDESPTGRTLFTRRAIKLLHLSGAFEPRMGDGLGNRSAEQGYDVVRSAFSKREPSPQLLRFAHVFIDGRVVPFLLGRE